MQQPRQMYGLGSFVKKIAKGVKGAVKGVKKFAKSDLGKTLGMAALAFGIPGTSMGGLFGRASFMTPGGVGVKGLLGKEGIMATLGQLPGASKLAETFGGEKTFGKVAGMFGIGTLGGAALNALSAGGVDDPEQIKDIATLKMQLANGYKLLNPGVGQDEVDEFVRNNIPVQNKAYGGRIGYAFGNDPEQNAVQASGIMGLPLNENPAGATELDLRETGGFIPPVGVKEKEDDIPAMLSNNEFVFTADAVRGMGDGDVNMGAQRMYDMMKKLENGGRV